MKFFLFAISLLLYYSLHSLLAHQKTKALLIPRWVPQKYYRLLFNATAIGLLIPIFFFYQQIPTSYIFENMVLKYAGMGIAGVGTGLLLFALSQYNLAEFAGTEQLRHATPPHPTSLKTTGFNAIVRHPLYFCGLLIIWGGFLVRPTYLYLVMALISTTYLYFGTKLEEEKLVAEFGAAYLTYQKRVGMLVPFF